MPPQELQKPIVAAPIAQTPAHNVIPEKAPVKIPAVNTSKRKAVSQKIAVKKANAKRAIAAKKRFKKSPPAKKRPIVKKAQKPAQKRSRA